MLTFTWNATPSLFGMNLVKCNKAYKQLNLKLIQFSFLFVCFVYLMIKLHMECSLHVRGEFLPQMEFKNNNILFIDDGRMEQEME